MNKRLLTVTCIAATALAVGVPATADEPTQVQEVVTFDEPDPCAPEDEMTTTLTLDLRTHEHRNVSVITATVGVETTNGYVGSGRGKLVVGPHQFSDTLTALVENEDGNRYKVNTTITVTPNGVAVAEVNIRCLTG